MSKAKTTQKPQEQPAAAPAEATPNVALAPNGDTIETQKPKEYPAPGNVPDAAQPAAAPEDKRVLEVKRALRSFPTLQEGYLTAKGVYFDKDVAEKSLAEGEELVIVERENKQQHG